MDTKVDEFSNQRAVVRGMGLVALSLILVPPYILSFPLGRRPRRLLAKTWCTGACRLMGLEVRRVGYPSTVAPVLFTPNHVSYLDTLVLGAQVDMVFVAKSEIAGWPLFGSLAKLARTVFIERSAVKTRAHIDVLAVRLGAGDSLVLFPEGTSTDGESVLPFKSSLFAVAYASANGSPIAVQPISIAYTRLKDGRAMEGALRDYYAFHGTMNLKSHVMAILKRRGAVVEVRFHEPVSSADFPSRKELARYCWSTVASGVSKSHADT